MLPAPHRLRRRRDFGVATRRGRRAGSATVVAHLALPSSDAEAGKGARSATRQPQEHPRPTPADVLGPAPGLSAHLAAAPPARVGFVVSGAVGPAVVRNRVRRRLRHLTAAHLRRLPDGALLVLRALPAATGATSSQLGADLQAVLDRLTTEPQRRRSPEMRA